MAPKLLWNGLPKDKLHKERTPFLSNIVSLLTLHEDQSDQKGKDANEPPLKELISNEPTKKKQSSEDQLFVKAASISAEIRVVLNFVTPRYLMNSSPNSGDLFSIMFADSDIAFLTFLYLLPNLQRVQFRKVKWISSFDFGTRRQTLLPHAA